jgi:hypothetical protein
MRGRGGAEVLKNGNGAAGFALREYGEGTMAARRWWLGREDAMIVGEMTTRWWMSVARRRRKSSGVNANSVRPSRKGRLRETTTRPDGSSESRVLATGDLAP